MCAWWVRAAKWGSPAVRGVGGWSKLPSSSDAQTDRQTETNIQGSNNQCSGEGYKEGTKTRRHMVQTDMERNAPTSKAKLGK